MTRTTQDFAKFLESLKVKNEGPEEMHGWRFDMHISYTAQHMTDCEKSGHLKELAEYLLYRCRRAEQNRIPEKLAEDVKAYMRAAMGISEKCADNSCPCPLDLEGTCYALEFRKLCEPTTDDKEHK